MNDTPTKFKIDTGADVTALPETLFKALESSLSPTSLKIRSADGTDMRVLGKFQAWLSTPDASSRQDVYVIRGQKNALLGRPAIIALNLLARLAAVNSESAVDIKREFPKLFTGLGKIPGLMDDVLIFGQTKPEHDARLRQVCTRLMEAGATLNAEKCQIFVSSVKFLGHVISASGISSDPEKVRAIRELPRPKDVADVRRLLGMINHVAKFLPHVSDMTEPLRSLLSKKNTWKWDSPQEQAFQKVKDALGSTPVLAHYSPNGELIVSADASSYGLGAVLLQRQDDGSIKPVAYASYSLKPAEQRYAQIEKEALALTWACERFNDYLLGLPHFLLYTDHKPLVPLLSPDKRLDELPLRIQRFRLRLARYRFTISHVPGSKMFTPDTLSRAPLPGSDPAADELIVCADNYTVAYITELPATPGKITEIKMKQQQDEVCSAAAQFSLHGWPDSSSLHGELKVLHSLSGEITVQNGLLLRGSRIVIPESLRNEILQKLHDGHLGIVKCRARAASSVWWPGLSKELKNLVENCDVCKKEKGNHSEPMMQSATPDRPWQVLGSDLFDWKGHKYLLLVDYLSRYPEIAKLDSEDSESVIQHMKSIFGRHGIPEVVRTDNGPQYASEAFHDFAQLTSSPRYPQSNGEAERMVQTVKGLLQKAEDPYAALLAYRASPLSNGFSPAEILMGRKLRTKVPTNAANLVPREVPLSQLRNTDEEIRKKQKGNYDKRHRSRDLAPLKEGDSVFLLDRREHGHVLRKATEPRSYYIATDSGTFRRNRHNVITVQGVESDSVEDDFLPYVKIRKHRYHQHSTPGSHRLQPDLFAQEADVKSNVQLDSTSEFGSVFDLERGMWSETIETL